MSGSLWQSLRRRWLQRRLVRKAIRSFAAGDIKSAMAFLDREQEIRDSIY